MYYNNNNNNNNYGNYQWNNRRLDDYRWQNEMQNVKTQMQSIWQCPQLLPQQRAGFIQNLWEQNTPYQEGMQRGQGFQDAHSMRRNQNQPWVGNYRGGRETQGQNDWEMKNEMLRRQLEFEKRKIEDEILAIIRPQGNNCDDRMSEMACVPRRNTTTTTTTTTVTQDTCCGFGRAFGFRRRERVSQSGSRKIARLPDFDRRKRPQPPRSRTSPSPSRRKEPRISDESRPSKSTAEPGRTATTAQTVKTEQDKTKEDEKKKQDEKAKKEEKVKQEEKAKKDEKTENKTIAQQGTVKIPFENVKDEPIFGTKLVKLFDLRSPVSLIKELIPGCDLEVDTIADSVPLTYEARITHGKDIVGIGKDAVRECSIRKAANDGMKTIFRWFLSDYNGKDEIRLAKNSLDMGNRVNIFPWHEFASAALYELFTDWHKEGVNLHIGNSVCEQERRNSGQPKVLTKLPHKAHRKNPIILLQQMKPGLTYFEVEKPTSANRYLMKVGYSIEGQTFIGRGHSRKSAKTEAAKVALTSLYGLHYMD